MAKNPWEFLSNWARENVHATALDDEPTAKALAETCLRDARAAGINQDSVIKAAHGDLSGFFLSELNSAANAEAERLAAKDKR